MPTPRRYASAAQRQAAYRQRLADARAKELKARGLPAMSPIASIPSHRRWDAMVRQAQALLETVVDEMTEYADERSEEWQESDRAEDFGERLDAVQEVAEQLEELAQAG